MLRRAPVLNVLSVLALALLLPLDSARAQALSPRTASYTIDVRLDASGRRLTARETLNWRNDLPSHFTRSSVTLPAVRPTSEPGCARRPCYTCPDWS